MLLNFWLFVLLITSVLDTNIYIIVNCLRDALKLKSGKNKENAPGTRVGSDFYDWALAEKAERVEEK